MKKDLREVFGKDYSIAMEPGIFQYIEGTCSEETKEKIDKIISQDERQKKTIASVLKFEKENGAGSWRKFIEKSVNETKLPDDLINLLEKKGP